VLDDFDEIGVCTGYRLNGEVIHNFPASNAQAEAIEPIFEMHEGWKTDLTGVRRWDDLPPKTRAYLARLGELIGTEVAMVGVGPERSQSIVKPGSWLARQMEALGAAR
jgi:adenylosuccinate synthase